MTGKGLNAEQRRALVLDVERGVTNGGETLPWQTDTCIGSWHYERSVFEQHKYKTAKQVSQMLIDIVSKNGNLQLSIPLPGNGVPDADELKFLAEFTAWMDVNSEGIYSTRPWKVYGEGPSVTRPGASRPVRRRARCAPLHLRGHAFHGQGRHPLRLHHGLAGIARHRGQEPCHQLAAHWTGAKSPMSPCSVTTARLEWTQNEQGLNVKLPATPPSEHAVALKIKGATT